MGNGERLSHHIKWVVGFKQEKEYALWTGMRKEVFQIRLVTEMKELGLKGVFMAG
jgi:hypothetical protein